MMTFKKTPSGDYYYFTKKHKSPNIIVRDYNESGGYSSAVLRFPKELIGKKVRLKLEIVGDDNG